MPRKQPYHDHPYTVIELPSYNSDEGMPDDTHEFEKSDDLTETSSRTDGCRLRYLASLFNPAFDLPTQSNITLKLKQGTILKAFILFYVLYDLKILFAVTIIQ